MEKIFFDCLFNISTLYIPNGDGPFPTVIIIKRHDDENAEDCLEFYAKKMNEIGFLAFTFIFMTEKQIESLYSPLNSAIDYIISRAEVDTKNIFLLMLDRENPIDINIELFNDRIQAMASLSWLS